MKDLARVEKVTYTPQDEFVRWRKRVLALRSDGTIWGLHVVRLRAADGNPEKSRNHGWKLVRDTKPIYVEHPELWVASCVDQGWKEVRR